MADLTTWYVTFPRKQKQEKKGQRTDSFPRLGTKTIVVLRRPLDVAFQDVVEDLLGSVVIEWRPTQKEFVHADTQWPPIDSWTVWFLHQELRCQVVWRAQHAAIILTTVMTDITITDSRATKSHDCSSSPFTTLHQTRSSEWSFHFVQTRTVPR